MRASGLNGHQRGYTYTVLLVVIAVVMASAAVAARVSSQVQQRAMERELLFRGDLYRRAIKSYYETGLPHRFPKSIKDLIDDPRFVNIHHLRRAWTDPMSPPGTQWTLILNDQGEITGVASRSGRKPIKVAGFPARYKQFKKAETYRDWKFIFDPSEMQAHSSQRNATDQMTKKKGDSRGFDF